MYRSGFSHLALLLVLLGFFTVPVAAQTDSFFRGQLRPVFGSYCPRNTLPADGRSLDIASNQALYSVLGCRFGGDCLTSFNLPDMRGRTPVGAGHSSLDQQDYQLAQRGGEPHPLTVAEMPPHTHTVLASQGAPNTGSPAGALPPTRTDGLNAFTPDMSGEQTVQLEGQVVAPAGGSAELAPYHPVLAINYCIQVVGVYPTRP